MILLLEPDYRAIFSDSDWVLTSLSILLPYAADSLIWGWNSTLPSFEIQVEKQGFIASNNRMDVESSNDPTPHEQWSSVTGLNYHDIKEINLALIDTDDG